MRVKFQVVQMTVSVLTFLAHGLWNVIACFHQGKTTRTCSSIAVKYFSRKGYKYLSRTCAVLRLFAGWGTFIHSNDKENKLCSIDRNLKGSLDFI